MRRDTGERTTFQAIRQRVKQIVVGPRDGIDPDEITLDPEDTAEIWGATVRQMDAPVRRETRQVFKAKLGEVFGAAASADQARGNDLERFTGDDLEAISGEGMIPLALLREYVAGREPSPDHRAALSACLSTPEDTLFPPLSDDLSPAVVRQQQATPARSLEISSAPAVSRAELQARLDEKKAEAAAEADAAMEKRLAEMQYAIKLADVRLDAARLG